MGKALTDPRLPKEPRDSQSNSEASALDRHLLATDPPDHTRLRKLVEGAFTSRRITSLRPRIEEITDELLDAISSAHDRVNLIDALAFPLPMKVVSELLGIPVKDQDSFRAWFGDLVADEGVIGPEREQASRVALARYIKDLISHRRDNVSDDLISGLIAVRDSEDRLFEDELISMVFLLLFAGHETTVNLIDNGAYLLLSDRDRERLRADRALLPGAIEEFLRFESPVEMTSNRTASSPPRPAVREYGRCTPAERIPLFKNPCSRHNTSAGRRAASRPGHARHRGRRQAPDLVVGHCVCHAVLALRAVSTAITCQSGHDVSITTVITGNKFRRRRWLPGPDQGLAAGPAA